MTMTRRSTAFVEFVKVWGVVAGIVVVGFVATYQYVDDPPPRAIRIAAGVENGAYTAFAERYARLLADDGIALEVVSTAGSVENLALLRNGDVTLALVQGGSATAETTIDGLNVSPLVQALHKSRNGCGSKKSPDIFTSTTSSGPGW
jgi:hypothetical protein